MFVRMPKLRYLPVQPPQYYQHPLTCKSSLNLCYEFYDSEQKVHKKGDGWEHLRRL